jgi:hypothetical protein
MREINYYAQSGDCAQSIKNVTEFTAEKGVKPVAFWASSKTEPDTLIALFSTEPGNEAGNLAAFADLATFAEGKIAVTKQQADATELIITIAQTKDYDKNKLDELAKILEPYCGKGAFGGSLAIKEAVKIDDRFGTKGEVVLLEGEYDALIKEVTDAKPNLISKNNAAKAAYASLDDKRKDSVKTKYEKAQSLNPDSLIGKLTAARAKIADDPAKARTKLADFKKDFNSGKTIIEEAHDEVQKLNKEQQNEKKAAETAAKERAKRIDAFLDKFIEGKKDIDFDELFRL